METTKTVLTVVAVILALACFGAVATMLALSLAQAEEALVEESQIEAQYDGDHLSVTVPFSKEVTGLLRGRLTCTLIDMEDNTIGEAVKNVLLRRRRDLITLDIPAKLKPEDLAAARIKYTFKYEYGEASGVVAATAVANWLEVRVLGQNRLLSGSNASLRIITLNHKDMRPVTGAEVKLVLSVGDKSIVLHKGKTDESGTLEAVVHIPEFTSEDVKLIIDVNSTIGKDTIEKAVKLVKVSRTYLVTDKPIYQPDQTVHMRTITLGRPAMLPLQGHDILIEIFDSKGNKVFKKKAKTDRFGVCSAQFALADEINMGRYKISATVGNDKTEKTVTVEKYVLPKFNVRLKTDKEYYMPGEKLKGSVSAVYFFGKPVVGGRVKVALSKFDVGFSKVGEAIGKTDKEGNFEFELRLPRYFVGQPLEQGNAFVKLEIEVKDLAEHIEKKSETRTVARSPIRITLIPESGEIVPSVSNRLYCMTTYPDGKPAVCNISLNDMVARSDAMGVATFEILPTGEKGLNVIVSAKDEQGNTATLRRNFTYNMGIPHLLLRTDRAIYKVGDAMDVTVFATKKSGRVYIDLIKDGQTMLTRSLIVKEGKATSEITMTQDLSGTVKVHAYLIGKTSDIARDTRTIYVNPANDLMISIKPDKKTYRPGEDGTIYFAVTDKNGRPVVSVIGAAIVDEAVFALTEMQPGMEKVYFTLEREIMTPRYEIHGFTPEQIVLPIEQDMRRQKAATILFASFQKPPEYTMDVNTYEQTESAVMEKIYSRVMRDLEKLRRAVRQFKNEKRRYPGKYEGLEPVVWAGFLKPSDLLDPWGTPYEVIARGNDLRWFDIRSWGPDKKKGTADDLSPSYDWRWAKKVGMGRFLKARAFNGAMNEEMMPAIPGDVT
ncbi:MAG: MG2 domain-containing protein, partial [bacterium]